jgi:hypothetical protein
MHVKHTRKSKYRVVHGTKKYCGVEVGIELHFFLTSAIEGGVWSLVHIDEKVGWAPDMVWRLSFFLMSCSAWPP